MKKHSTLLMLTVFLTIYCFSNLIYAAEYYYYDLGTLGGSESYASGINDLGQVTGYSRNDSGGTYAFLWTPPSGMKNLGTIVPYYGYSMASSINNLGQVVGVGSTLDAANAFLWTSSGGMQDLGKFTIPGYTLGGSNASSINNSGYVVGSSYIDLFSLRAVLWSSIGNMQNLGTLGGKHSDAYSINDNGQVVGMSWIDNSGTNRAFSWTSSGGMKYLGDLVTNLPAYATALVSARDINKNGTTVGFFEDNRPGYWVGSTWSTFSLSSNGEFTPLWQNGIPNSINDKNQVVGSLTGASNTYATIWEQGKGVQNLNSLTVNLPNGTSLWQAKDINNKGQIVGTTYDGSNIRGVLLTPTSLSKTYGLFIGVQDSPEKPGASDIRGDDSAILLSSSFNNLPNVVYNQYLKGDLKNGSGISISAIENKINEIKNTIQAGDKLFVYVMGHGYKDLISGDYKINIGKDLLSNTVALTDDNLTSMLQGLDTVSKYIILDSCESGGFWDDLSNLKNRALIAAAPAGKYAYAVKTTGYGVLSLDLTNGFLKSGDTIKADGDGNKDLTFNELSDWAKNWDGLKNYDGTIVTQMDFGDQTVFDLDKWNPVFLKSDDFVDGLATNQVPIPSSIILLGSALISLAGYTRIRNNLKNLC